METGPLIPYVMAGLENDTSPSLRRSSVIFVEGSELAEVERQLDALVQGREDKPAIFLHIDFIDGLGKDAAGLRFIRRYPALSGIITVKGPLTSVARDLGLHSVLRVFLHDSRAVERGLHLIKAHRPDAVELLPAVAAVGEASSFLRTGVPCIAGGLIHNVKTVETLLQAGFKAVSASDHKLWDAIAKLQG